MGGRLEEYASELAHHYEQAEPMLGNQKLVRYSMSAGATKANALRPDSSSLVEDRMRKGSVAP